MTNEQRLEQLREQAWDKGIVVGRGVDVAGGPIARRPGYYGEPVVKPPVWTWEIPLATYTGVLLGATAIPAWFLHRIFLPIHFGAAGLGSAAALLELLGHRIAPLNAIGFLAAGIETALWIWLEINRHGAADRALHAGHSGWLIRGSEILSGPLALILRLANLVPLAGISFLLGALINRFGWISAGKVCARDPEAVFASQR